MTIPGQMMSSVTPTTSGGTGTALLMVKFLFDDGSSAVGDILGTSSQNIGLSSGPVKVIAKNSAWIAVTSPPQTVGTFVAETTTAGISSTHVTTTSGKSIKMYGPLIDPSGVSQGGDPNLTALKNNVQLMGPFSNF
jgi:hypothetical protein